MSGAEHCLAIAMQVSECRQADRQTDRLELDRVEFPAVDDGRPRIILISTAGKLLAIL